MKFTLDWLKDHLETEAAAQEIAEALTMIGLELEALEDQGQALSEFVVARVVTAEKHPNADKLKVCKVDAGTGDLIDVVCGAPNARAGMKGVFAFPGTYIPGTDFALGKGNIRGQASDGMLCSGRELELSDDHSGIIELPDDAPVGARYADYAGLTGIVFDIAVTPNRGDAAGVRGIARDLAVEGDPAGPAVRQPRGQAGDVEGQLTAVGLRLDLDQVGEPDPVIRFALARMRLLGAPWIVRAPRPIQGIEGSTALPIGEVAVTSVSTENIELGYESPPGLGNSINELGSNTEGLGVQVNEKSLRTIARDLTPGTRAEAYHRFTGGSQNLLAYREEHSELIRRDFPPQRRQQPGGACAGAAGSRCSSPAPVERQDPPGRSWSPAV